MSHSITKLPVILLSLLVPFLASCVRIEEIPLSDSSAIRGKNGLQTERERPPFTAVTAGKATGAAFGAIGGAIAGAAMVKSGNAIVSENGVEDPANWISQELASQIKRKYGTTFKGTRKVTDEKPESIAKACTGADFALDVRTINWSLGYFPVNWATYRVFYSAQLRIIDCKTGVVVAQGFYARLPEKSDDSPDWDELVENNKAERLKKELKIGAQEALHHFKTNILKL
jgi:hypothetical protein